MARNHDRRRSDLGRVAPPNTKPPLHTSPFLLNRRHHHHISLPLFAFIVCSGLHSFFHLFFPFSPPFRPTLVRGYFCLSPESFLGSRLRLSTSLLSSRWVWFRRWRDLQWPRMFSWQQVWGFLPF
uniref:Transmembrane protein n=1 Tax=Fagus sylvatica TaxID=28930 RepID=A0A2N9H9N6_FAGSY